MGIWGPEILSDDLAADVHSDFLARYDAGETVAAITRALHRTYAEPRSDLDEGPVFWLALAQAQWECGALDPAVLAEVEDMSQADIAALVDKSRSHVANLQRLLALPEGVIQLVEHGKLSMGHARALIGHDRAEALADEAVAKNLSVREVEKRVRAKGDGWRTPSKSRNAAPARTKARPMSEFERSCTARTPGSFSLLSLILA